MVWQALQFHPNSELLLTGGRDKTWGGPGNAACCIRTRSTPLSCKGGVLVRDDTQNLEG